MAQPNTKKRHMNISSLTIAQTSPVTLTAVTVEGIKSFDIDPQYSNIQDAGDGDLGPTYSANDFQDPAITFNSTAAFILAAAMVPGHFYTIVATINDADLGAVATDGGKLITATNCFIDGAPTKNQYRQYSTTDLKVGTIWADGVTNPITVAAL